MSAAQVTRLLLVLWFVFGLGLFVAPIIAALGNLYRERPSMCVLLFAVSMVTGAAAIASLGYIVWMWVVWGLTP